MVLNCTHFPSKRNGVLQCCEGPNQIIAEVFSFTDFFLFSVSSYCDLLCGWGKKICGKQDFFFPYRSIDICVGGCHHRIKSKATETIDICIHHGTFTLFVEDVLYMERVCI
jgi:hypothetical protein